jgi:hypothetical protein
MVANIKVYGLSLLLPIILLASLCRCSSADGEGEIWKVWNFGNSFSQSTLRDGFTCLYERWVRTLFGVKSVEMDFRVRNGADLGVHADAIVSGMYPNNYEPVDLTLGDRVPWVLLQEQSMAPALPASLEWSIYNADILVDYFQQNGVEHVLFIQTWGYMYPKGGSTFPDFLSHSQALLEGYVAIQKETTLSDYPTYVAPCGLAFEKVYLNCVEQGLDPGNSRECAWTLLYNDCTYFAFICYHFSSFLTPQRLVLTQFGAGFHHHFGQSLTLPCAGLSCVPWSCFHRLLE